MGRNYLTNELTILVNDIEKWTEASWRDFVHMQAQRNIFKSTGDKPVEGLISPPWLEKYPSQK